MSYNSPYGKFRMPELLPEEFQEKWWDGDVEVYYGAVPLYQEQYRSQNGDDRPVCRSCFFGIHPHAIRKERYGAYQDSQDCKVELQDREGKLNGNQCMCTWSEKNESI